MPSMRKVNFDCKTAYLPEYPLIWNSNQQETQRCNLDVLRGLGMDVRKKMRP